MQGIRRTGASLVAAATLLIPLGVWAQTATGPGPTASHTEALADVEANRSLVIRDTVDRWRVQFRPFNPSQNTGGEEERLTATLLAAPADKLLAASRAETYEEALAAVEGRWRGPSVIPVEGPIPNTLGSSTNDLVFTPVTACRIIDTRVATDPALLGPIPANTGKQFSVSLANYASQGGNAGTCSIPIAPAAVAINVTSTNQSGPGNLRVIQTGGGVPTASLLNYTPGVNLANAAVARSSGSVGGNNIFIYSGNSSSDVVVDIMGYFAAPVATALDSVVLAGTYVSPANGATFTATSPSCSAGYLMTGGGFQVQVFTSGVTFVYDGPNCAPNATDCNAWLCQGSNNSGSTQNIRCWVVCNRVPGR